MGTEARSAAGLWVRLPPFSHSVGLFCTNAQPQSENPGLDRSSGLCYNQPIYLSRQLIKYASLVGNAIMLDHFLALQRINKDIPVPYYYQIAQVLREAIEDADIEERKGEIALPSEAELCSFFHVTRGTVRHALQTLEQEGLIYREKGRGSFLRRQRVELDLTHLCSTTEDLKIRGWIPAVTVLSLMEVVPRPHIRRALGVSEETTVWEIYRLRLANGEPISLQWSYIPTELAPGLDQEDLTGSLYYILKDKYGIFLRTAEQFIRTRAATVDEADLLEVAEGTPVFVIDRTTHDQNGLAVEHLNSLWRGDRYDLRVALFSRGCAERAEIPGLAAEDSQLRTHSPLR